MFGVRIMIWFQLSNGTTSHFQCVIKSSIFNWRSMVHTWIITINMCSEIPIEIFGCFSEKLIPTDLLVIEKLTEMFAVTSGRE